MQQTQDFNLDSDAMLNFNSLPPTRCSFGKITISYNSTNHGWMPVKIRLH